MIELLLQSVLFLFKGNQSMLQVLILLDFHILMFKELLLRFYNEVVTLFGCLDIFLEVMTLN